MDLSFGSYNEIVELLISWLQEYVQIINIEKDVGVIYCDIKNQTNRWPSISGTEFIVEIYHPGEFITDLDIESNQWSVRFLNHYNDRSRGYRHDEIVNLSDPESFRQMVQVIGRLTNDNS